MKILYFGDCTKGAMGIIHRDIKSIIDRKYPDITFSLMDWSDPDNYVSLFHHMYWKEWDMIIVDPFLAHVLNTGWGFTDWSDDLKLEFKNKLIPVYHHEVDVPADHFNHGWYEGWFTTPVCSINPYIVNQIIERGQISSMLPIGVNRERFKQTKKVSKIKRAGFVGGSTKEDWLFIKRPDLFVEICKDANIEPVMIRDRENGSSMYEDIDLIICPSRAEGLPTYFAEAVACKVPFISTDVGIVRYSKKVKKFDSIESAVEIINYLNESEDNIHNYVNEVYDEMFPDRDWENILEKYWIPHFKKMMK